MYNRKNLFKTIASLLLVMIMVVSFAGCGDTDASVADSSGSEKSTDDYAQYAGTYKATIDGDPMLITLYKDKTWAVQIPPETSTVKLMMVFIDELDFYNNSIIIGTYKVSDNGDLYLSIDDNITDNGIKSLFPNNPTRGSYDGSAEVINVPVGDEETSFMKTEDLAITSYTTKDLGESATNVASQTQPDPADETINEDSPKPEGQQDKYIQAVDDFLGNPVQQGWAMDYSYLTKIAEDHDFFYWQWAAGGVGGLVSQSKGNPRTVQYEDTKDLMLYAIWASNGYQYFAFDDIYYSGTQSIEYNGEMLEGEVCVCIDPYGNKLEAIQTSIIPQIILDEYPPEEYEFYRETTLFVGGQPWVGFESISGWPYVY